MTETKYLPSFCYNCVAGPDPMKIKVENGIACEIVPNFELERMHPGMGRVCVKALGLIQKTYSPHRITTPMKRTNPKKGRDEDPGFAPISWDEALDIVADKLNETRSKGVKDEAGLPRVAATFGHGGTPQNYMGVFPAFLSAWGPIDFSFGSGQGVKCVHSEHLYGEFWHRGFTVGTDTPNAKYIVSFGFNPEASGGPCSVRRHADARERGLKRIQVEPHLSITGACSAEWVPIKPKTDAAFLFGMVNVLLFEQDRDALDLPFIRERTSSSYLVGPSGYYLRDPDSGKPLVWDTEGKRAVPHDTQGITEAIDGTFDVGAAVEFGPDQERYEHSAIPGTTAFTMMAATMKEYTPEWAEEQCDVPADTIRRVANEFLENACIGETIEVDGRELPYRPVSVVLGKTVNNGWGAYHCCWARTVLATLVGGLEVPGGTIGTTVRLHRPIGDRVKSVQPGEDGFMNDNANPTDKEHWEAQPSGRNAHKTLIPIVGTGAWAQALGPTHLAWMFVREAPEAWDQPSYPDVWFVYRSNPAISFWDLKQMTDTIASFPFMVAFAYTQDETNYMADILLPDATDLESTQLIRAGGTKYVEQAWDEHGVILRQKVVEPQGDARDMSWIAQELAKRTGLTEGFYAAINRGAGGIPLAGEGFDFSLDVAQDYEVDEIWDHVCKAASTRFSGGEETYDLEWFKEHGYYMAPFKRTGWYLYPIIEDMGLRFELPYQERLVRWGEELKRRLHEKGVHWWDEQLKEYQPIPTWHDVPGVFENAIRSMGGDPDDYPFWALTTKSMQYAAGNNAGIQMMDDVAKDIRGHGTVKMNSSAAKRLGIERGDQIELRSVIGVTRGRAEPMQGIRPDTVCIEGQFDYWATPYAKDLGYPSINTITPMSLELTDATGSGADIVRLSIKKVGEAV